jgi:predicted RNA binding protein YcfA (HicA-like mRNA interferase family)
MKHRDFIKHLVAHGCIKVREGGRHSVWQNPNNGKISTVPRHREIKDMLTRVICRQLEIPAP